jgi:hypothetical protein
MGFSLRSCQPPEAAMRRYVKWLKNLPDKAVFLGYPVA